MTYELKPLSCNPAKLKGLSEKLIVRHYENNYGGAVKRLNAIATQIEALDLETTPVFAIKRPKREELIAGNSMIPLGFYYDRLRSDGEPVYQFRSRRLRDSGGLDRWQAQ